MIFKSNVAKHQDLPLKAEYTTQDKYCFIEEFIAKTAVCITK